MIKCPLCFTSKPKPKKGWGTMMKSSTNRSSFDKRHPEQPSNPNQQSQLHRQPTNQSNSKKQQPPPPRQTQMQNHRINHTNNPSSKSPRGNSYAHPPVPQMDSLVTTGVGGVAVTMTSYSYNDKYQSSANRHHRWNDEGEMMEDEDRDQQQHHKMDEMRMTDFPPLPSKKASASAVKDEKENENEEEERAMKEDDSTPKQVSEKELDSTLEAFIKQEERDLKQSTHKEEIQTIVPVTSGIVFFEKERGDDPDSDDDVDKVDRQDNQTEDQDNDNRMTVSNNESKDIDDDDDFDSDDFFEANAKDDCADDIINDPVPHSGEKEGGKFSLLGMFTPPLARLPPIPVTKLCLHPTCTSRVNPEENSVCASCSTPFLPDTMPMNDAIKGKEEQNEEEEEEQEREEEKEETNSDVDNSDNYVESYDDDRL